MLDRTDPEGKVVLGKLPTSAKPGSLESLARIIPVPVSRTEDPPQPQNFYVRHKPSQRSVPDRIIGSFRLEKTLKIIKSGCKPRVAKPSTDPYLGIARCSPGLLWDCTRNTHQKKLWTDNSGVMFTTQQNIIDPGGSRMR